MPVEENLQFSALKLPEAEAEAQEVDQEDGMVAGEVEALEVQVPAEVGDLVVIAPKHNLATI